MKKYIIWNNTVSNYVSWYGGLYTNQGWPDKFTVEEAKYIVANYKSLDWCQYSGMWNNGNIIKAEFQLKRAFEPLKIGFTYEKGNYVIRDVVSDFALHAGRIYVRLHQGLTVPYAELTQRHHATRFSDYSAKDFIQNYHTIKWVGVRRPGLVIEKYE